jgi:GNAT superfamily N-acetyltransferase
MTQVREATAADYEAYTHLVAQLGVDDPTPSRTRWEAEMAPHTIVIEEGGAVAAYAYARVLGDVGYVFNVVVDVPQRGRGLGGVLMRAVAERLRAQGCSRWVLNVKIDNEPAIRLYERWGLARAYRSTAFSVGWDLVAALPRDEARVSAREVDPTEDAAIEGAFGLPPGRLADRRKRSGVVVLRLVDEARPDDPKVGVACFDPAFPGSFPFAVGRPSLASHLLAAMKERARPEDTSVNLVAEHDDALAELLRGAGARVKFEMFHMTGEIPA